MTHNTTNPSPQTCIFPTPDTPGIHDTRNKVFFPEGCTLFFKSRTFRNKKPVRHLHKIQVRNNAWILTKTGETFTNILAVFLHVKKTPQNIWNFTWYQKDPQTDPVLIRTFRPPSYKTPISPEPQHYPLRINSPSDFRAVRGIRDTHNMILYPEGCQLQVRPRKNSKTRDTIEVREGAWIIVGTSSRFFSIEDAFTGATGQKRTTWDLVTFHPNILHSRPVPIKTLIAQLHTTPETRDLYSRACAASTAISELLICGVPYENAIAITPLQANRYLTTR